MATKSNPQKKNSNSAVELNEQASIRYLPEHIIREILIRLPVKSILRFKSTNKTWYSLIRSRHFIDYHRLFKLIYDSHHNELFYNNAPSGNTHPCDGPHIISCFSSSSTNTNANGDAKVFDLETLRSALVGDNIRPPLAITLELIHVLGPLSNGICCVIAEEFVKSTTGTYGDGYCNFAFCNLATREFNLLPPTNTSRDSSFGGISIEFVSNYTFGFGNIINRKCGRNLVVDYKMVVIAQESLLLTFEAYVYSQRRGTWELIGDSNNPRRCATEMVNEHGKVQFPKITQDLYWFSMQAYLHGSCHWMARLPYSDYEYCVVLYFDMENEVFGLIPAPPTDDYVHILKSTVFVLDNHLAVFVLVRGTGHSLSLIDVWVMVEYGVEESWTKIHSCQIHLSGYYIDKFLGMSFSEDDNGVTRTIDRIFFAHKGNLVSCDRTSFRIHCDYKSWWGCWKTVGLSEYFDTLEPLELEGVDEDNT